MVRGSIRLGDQACAPSPFSFGPYNLFTGVCVSKLAIELKKTLIEVKSGQVFLFQETPGERNKKI